MRSIALQFLTVRQQTRTTAWRPYLLFILRKNFLCQHSMRSLMNKVCSFPLPLLTYNLESRLIISLLGFFFFFLKNRYQWQETIKPSVTFALNGSCVLLLNDFEWAFLFYISRDAFSATSFMSFSNCRSVTNEY